MKNLILESVQQYGALQILIIGILIGSVILDIVLLIFLIAKRKTYRKSQKLFRWFWITFTLSYLLFFAFGFLGLYRSEPTSGFIFDMIITLFIPLIPAVLLLIFAFINRHNEKKLAKLSNPVSLQDLHKTKIETANKNSETTLHCLYCGLRVEKTDKKCPYCGAHIK